MLSSRTGVGHENPGLIAHTKVRAKTTGPFSWAILRFDPAVIKRSLGEIGHLRIEMLKLFQDKFRRFVIGTRGTPPG